MAGIVETGGNTVYWEDIEGWVGTLTSSEMANELNSDYRHFNECTVEQIYNVLFDTLEIIEKNLGLGVDPDADTGNWRGPLDTYHRELGGGQINTILKRSWNRILTFGQYSTKVIPCVNPDPPQTGQQDSIYERTGLTLTKWDEACQNILEATAGYPAYTGTYTGGAQGCHDLWTAITGGRRFGIVTVADIDQVIADHDTDTARQSAAQVVNPEASQLAALINDTAAASYQAGKTDAQIRADYDQAIVDYQAARPALPYPPLS